MWRAAPCAATLKDERRRKADELIAMIRATGAAMHPPALIYRWKEAEGDESVEIGLIPRPAEGLTVPVSYRDLDQL